MMVPNMAPLPAQNHSIHNGQPEKQERMDDNTSDMFSLDPALSEINIQVCI